MRVKVVFGETGEALHYDSSTYLADYPFILMDNNGEECRFCEEELKNLSKAITKVLEIYNA